MLNIARSGSHYALSARAGNTIANLDLRTCRALRALEELAGVRAEGVVESAYAFAGSKALPTKGSAVLPLSVNVYGPLSVADQCGDALAAASASLQLPFFLPPGYGGYFNPQMFRVGNEMQDQTHLVGLTEKDLRAKAISNKVEQILGSLYDTDAASSDAISEANLEQEALVTALTEYTPEPASMWLSRLADRYQDTNGPHCSSSARERTGRALRICKNDCEISSTYRGFLPLLP